MKKLIVRVMTSVLGFTLMLFFFIPSALDRPVRTLAFGIGWGVVVTTACYAFIRIVEWIIRLSQAAKEGGVGTADDDAST